MRRSSEVIEMAHSPGRRGRAAERARLAFARLPGMGSLAGATGYEAWIVDPDGGNLTELQVGNLAQLSSANCLVCPYLPDPAFPFIDNAVWQPVP